MALTPLKLAQLIKQRAQTEGFSAVGITTAAPLKEEADRLRWWLGRGYHGTMSWMARYGDRRAWPQEFFPEARSVVMVALNYYRSDEPVSRPPDVGNISIYARGRDYHRVMRKKLKRLLKFIQEIQPNARGRVCVDSFPIMEKPLAQRAGLGWMGKHTNLIIKQRGSYFFLGALLLSLELPPDDPFAVDFCGHCTRCLDACPTDALVAPYVLDASRCISYLTIEHRGEIATNLKEQMGNWVFGCDICQEVCPWNRFRQNTLEGDFRSRVPEEWWKLPRMIRLSREQFEKIFRGTPVLRAGYDRFMQQVKRAYWLWKRALEVENPEPEKK